ncbi:MAG: tetratricopeptide repeat protein [Candidatus Cyclobacteriaceae bacterium M3_2C_046]
MATDDQIRELIDQYLRGELSSNQTQTLMEKLAQDPELKKIFEQEKILVEGIRKVARQKNLHRLMQLEQSLPEVKPKRTLENSLNNRFWIGLAATLLIMAVTYVFFFHQFKLESQELYAQHFEPYPNIVYSIKRSSQEPQSQLKTTFQLYEQEDYEQAIQGFEQLPPEAVSPTTLFYQGNAHLVLGQAEPAIDLFRQVIESQQEFANQAKWYLSLAYLSQDQPKIAREWLQQIVTDQNSYSPKAQAILDKM